MHSEGTRVRSLFRSFINPPPWIQPASIPLPTPALRPTALPWPCCTHKRTQTGRNLVVRAHRSSPYVLIQFLIPLRPLLHPPPPTHLPFPRFTTAPLCFSSLHLFPGFSLSESTLFLHATLASRGWEGRGETGGGQVTHADLIWNRVNTRFPANVWLGTKTGMVVCGPNEMRIVFDVTVLPGVIVD